MLRGYFLHGGYSSGTNIGGEQDMSIKTFGK